MNRSILCASAIALVAVAAACGGGGGSGSQAVPNATARASGSVVLSIPVATTQSDARKPQYISSAAQSVSMTVNGGAATIYNISSSSTLCTTANSVRTCTIAISAVTGMLSVAVALYPSIDGSGTALGSATGSTTVTAPAPFTVSVDIEPAITAITAHTLTFANGLPTIAYKQAGSGTLSFTFTDASGVAIPATNTSTFLQTISLGSSDPHVTISPSTITNASQTVTLTYDGSNAVAPTFTISAYKGTFILATLSMKTAGYSYEYATTTSNAGPVGITVGPNAEIWFTEQTGNNIGRVNYTSPYTFPPTISEFPIPFSSSAPLAIAPGPASDTRLWFSEPPNYQHGTIDSATPSPIVQSSGGPDIGLRGVVSLAGYVWYADPNANAVDKLDPTYQSQVGQATITNCLTNYLAAGSDGNLWGTCSNLDEVFRVNPSTLAVTVFSTNGTTSGIAAGPDGAMWFTEGAIAKIGRIAVAAPNAYTESAVVPAGSAAQPLGIVAGSDGALWFTEATTGVIGRIDPTTKAIVEFPLASTLTQPQFITAGPDGFLWFTEFGTSKIGRMQPAS